MEGEGRKKAGTSSPSINLLAWLRESLRSISSFPALCRNISGNIYSSLQPGVFDELPALKIV